MKIVVMDTETTGLDPVQGAALLEVAWVVLSDESGAWDYAFQDSYCVRHDGPIPPEAKAVHHISERDVDERSDAIPREALVHSMLSAEEPGDMLYAFHNRAFDLKFLPELTLPTICTYRCALHLWPDAPSHANQVLRYWRGVEPPVDMLKGLAPHRAAYDAAVTAAVLLSMLKERSPRELMRLTTEPVLQRKVRFGKHRGEAWKDVPKSYLRWLLKSSDVVREDADVAHTARHHLS